MLGGREGMPRSLGSVYGGAVTRFLGGSLRGVVSRVIPMPPGVKSWSNGIAVSHDGRSLLVCDSGGGSSAIHVVSLSDGTVERRVGDYGTGPLQFSWPYQLCVAPDGLVYIADHASGCVQVLSPDLSFRGFIGGTRKTCGDCQAGVCASADVVVCVGVVSSDTRPCVAVLRRRDGAKLAQFGSAVAARVCNPRGVCLTALDTRIAIANRGSNCVSVFTLDGSLVRHVGVGVLSRPEGVASSACDELVVADRGNRCVRVFSDGGELLMTFGDGDFTGVAIYGAAVLAMDCAGERCLMWS
jgi:DNA-binding beta-propeller fold protein YncE